MVAKRVEVVRYPADVRKPAVAYRYLADGIAVRASSEGIEVERGASGRFAPAQAMTLAEILMTAAAMRFEP